MSPKLKKYTAALKVALLSSFLFACGEDIPNNTPVIDTGGGGTNFGAETNQLLQRFKDTVYLGPNGIGGVLMANCNGCHSVMGGQPPHFADDNASNAFNIAMKAIPDTNTNTNPTNDPDKYKLRVGDVNGTLYPLFDVGVAARGSFPAIPADPANSAVVRKIRDQSHNCWTASCADDAQVLQDQIQAFLDGGGLSQPELAPSGDILDQLVAPTVIADPTVYKSYPTSPTSGFSAIHSLLTQYCSGCHVETSQTPQTPFFAVSDEAASYQALIDNRKIDINIPGNSRLYLRLNNDSHNCWTVCSTNADEMLTNITNWANAAPGGGVLPTDWVTSKALELGQGIEVGGGVRYEPYVIAKYTFSEGTGNVAADTSGYQPSIDLNFDSSIVTWVGGYGLDFKNGGFASASGASSQRLKQLINTPAGEFSVEAWVIPANATQGTVVTPAVIASYSLGPNERNFTFGQAEYRYTLAARRTELNADGADLVTTPDAPEALQANLQHVVAIYSPVNGRTIYVNGELVLEADLDGEGALVAPNDLGDWSEDHIFAVGAETSGQNAFTGKIRMLAIHNRALSETQVVQNYEAGVGQKFNLMFKVGHLDDTGSNAMPDASFVLFTGEEFDDFSYKLFDPRFIVLAIDSGVTAQSTGSIALKDLRLGLNGKLPQTGQVFGKLDTTITWSEVPSWGGIIASETKDFVDNDISQTDAADPNNNNIVVPVRSNGTVIAKEYGPTTNPADQFFLTFAQIADKQKGQVPAVADPGWANPSYTAVAADNAKIRIFDEVYESMAKLAGIDPTITASADPNTANISDVYNIVRQALPSIEDPATFVAAQQVSATRLAFEFCDALVSNKAGNRASFFGSFNFGGDMATAFGGAAKQDMAKAFTDNMVGINIGNQPSEATIAGMLFTDVDTTPTDGTDQTALFTRLETECSAIVPAVDCTSSTRTAKVVTSMCMAVLGSATMLIQ